MNGRTKVALIGAGAVAAAALLRQPHADLAILTHRAGDPAPHVLRVAFDAGLMAGTVLVTWTADGIAR